MQVPQEARRLLFGLSTLVLRPHSIARYATICWYLPPPPSVRPIRLDALIPRPRASPAPHTHEARSTTRRATGIALSECGLASTRRRRDAGAARGANRERVRARAFRTVGVARHRPVRGLHDISSRSRFRAVSLARSLPRQPLPCNCKKVSSRRAAWACLHQPDGWVETLQR